MFHEKYSGVSGFNTAMSEKRIAVMRYYNRKKNVERAAS